MDKTVYFSMPNDVTHGRGYIYSLQYHIVWVTKYRKPIFTCQIEQDIREYLLKTLESLDMIPIAMEIMPDHILVFKTSGNQTVVVGRSFVESVIFCRYCQ